MSAPGDPTTAARSTGSAVWVSTSLNTRGGVASYVRGLRHTPLWETWTVRHIATHRDGSVPQRIVAFGTGLVEFLRALATQRPDVVHLHMASYGSFVRKATLAWLAGTWRVPVVLHVHGGEFGRFHDRSPRLLQRFIRATLTRAHAVVALGDRWAQRLRRIAPDARVVVIPNAVRPGRAVTQPPGDGTVHVVFLGGVAEHKGTFTLLEAWAALIGGPPAPVPARLTIAGDGEVARAEEAVHRLGIGSSVCVRGWLPPAESHTLLRSAHVLALPSRAEGQPMAVLEAMANGLCVVASDVGGIPDLITDGTTGLLVAPSDPKALAGALQRVIIDHRIRAQLGAAAHRRACREFDVDVVWRRIDQLYREVLR